MTDYVAGGRSVGAAPRTTDARNAREVAALARRRTMPSVALWGMAMVVASEATLFGCLFGTYFYLRFRALHWPPPGIPEPRIALPLILLGVLAAGSVPMLLAARAGRGGRLWSARAWLVLALVLQSGYLAYELSDLLDQLTRFDATTNAYGSIYFTLLGADHAHVFVGLLLDVWLLWKLARGLTMYRLNALQAIALYWAAVVVLTAGVVGTLLSATV